MDDRQLWERLREQRLQKEQKGTSALPLGADATRGAAAAPDGVNDAARQKLRAALEAFRQQQEATRPGGAVSRPDEEEDLGPDDGAPAPPPRSKKEIEEAFEYLEDALASYGRFVANIGDNGFTAPMVLYYRDEVQELLDELMTSGVELGDYWLRTVELDDEVRRNAQALVDEIGWANFKQYQIINDPPAKYWWWYLNRQTRAPAPPPPFWQFWKPRENVPSPPTEPTAEP